MGRERPRCLRGVLRAERGKGQHKGGVVPSEKSKSDKKIETQRNDLAAEQKIMQPVVRTERVSAFFVHYYLACGHMVTMRKEDLKESSLSSIQCWACEEIRKKGFPST